MSELPTQSPLYHAEHSGRYERWDLIRLYEEETDARLIVVIDIIESWSITYLEELLFDADPSKDIHLMLDTPGGDGEIAVRMARSMQARCKELTVIVPDRAKSAGTLLAMGAHNILMGYTSDLGPVDPQLYVRQADPPLVAAKDLIYAIDRALEQVYKQPDTYPLLASLLSDVSYLRYQQAKSAIDRMDDLIYAALASNPDRTDEQVVALFDGMEEKSIVMDPKVHSAILGIKEAMATGLPVQEASSGKQWELIWRLWTKYFYLMMGSKRTLIYESRTASHVLTK